MNEKLIDPNLAFMPFKRNADPVTGTNPGLK